MNFNNSYASFPVVKIQENKDWKPPQQWLLRELMRVKLKSKKTRIESNF